jgi:uncharacterized membrane protein YkvA (DUF1232 family)
MWLVRLRLLLKSVGREALVLLYALRHPETPRGIRLAILGLLVYVISPVDLVPDVLLLLGWADDAALVLMGVPWLVRRLPARVVGECSEAAGRLLARFGFGGN